ncbi:MAG: hypothetical protein ABI345_04705 [Jatrophihabitans sp.]
MIRLVRGEFLKLRTTQVWFWLLVGTIALSALLMVGGIAPSDGVRSADKVPDLLGSYVTAPGYIFVFVLGVLAVTTEYRYETITPTVLQTPSRWSIISAKLIAYSIVAVLFALVAILVELAVAVPWLSSKNVSVDLGNGEVQHALLGVFGVVVLFGIIGLGVGALLRNQIVAVVVGIVFLLVVQNIILIIPGVRNAWPYTPNGGLQAIMHTTGSTQVVDNVHLVATGAGVLVLLLWAVIPAIAGAAVTMNRDIT